MSGATSTGPEERVCPDCGSPTGDRPFCGSCGRNLASVERLPTRAEWEATESVDASGPDDEASRDDPRQGTQTISPESAIASATRPASDIGKSAWCWLRGHRLIAGAGAVVIATAIVVIILVSSGSGGVDPIAAENSVALYVAGAANVNPGDASCTFNSTVSPGVFQYTCWTTVEGVKFQTMDATYDAHKDINYDPSAVSISNAQTVNVPPGYTYDPSTGKYGPGLGIATPGQ